MSETRVFLRPLGSPLALALGGLALASIATAGLELGWVPLPETDQVAILVLVTAVPLQIVASVVAFLARDGATASAMGLLSATWASLALVLLLAPPGSTSIALGTVLVLAGALLLAAGVTTGKAKAVPGAAIALTGLRFAVLGVFQLGAGSPWQDAAGVLSCVVATVAAYASWASDLEDARGHTVAPLGRKSPVEEEPGVRPQL